MGIFAVLPTEFLQSSSIYKNFHEEAMLFTGLLQYFSYLYFIHTAYAHNGHRYDVNAGNFIFVM